MRERRELSYHRLTMHDELHPPDQTGSHGNLLEDLQAHVDNHGWLGVLFALRTIADDEGRDELAEGLDDASTRVTE